MTISQEELQRLEVIKREILSLNGQVGQLEHEAATILSGTDDCEDEDYDDAVDHVMEWSFNRTDMTTAELLKRCGLSATPAGRADGGSE